MKNTRFLKNVNLPEGAVAAAAVSSLHKEVLNCLKEWGIEPICIEPCKELPEPICSHADLICHPVGDKKVIVAKSAKKISQLFRGNGAEVIESEQSPGIFYPKDVGLCAARIGKRLIANPETLDKSILNICKEKKLELLPVRQGYAKCSTAIVDNHSIITSDCGIAKVAKAAGLAVLRIRPGFIELPGYDTGFIGGCCGLIAKKRMLFSGRIEEHPDYIGIKAFLEERQIEIVSVDIKLRDIGGILPIKEFYEL